MNGESKLSLTTQSLSLLNVSFRRYSDAKHGESSRNKHWQEFEKWRVNVQYLHDFITKTLSLKVKTVKKLSKWSILIAKEKKTVGYFSAWHTNVHFYVICWFQYFIFQVSLVLHLNFFIFDCSNQLRIIHISDQK